jgi:hypothetical protein
MTTMSRIARVPCASDEDITRLMALLEHVTCANEPLNAKTASNLLRYARLSEPAPRPADVASFVRWKMKLRGGSFRNWGGVVTAVRDDYASWKADPKLRPEISNTPIDDSILADESITIGNVREHLMAIRNALPRETSGWPPPNKSTSRTVLRAVREKDPTADPAQIGQLVRDIIINNRFKGWGGVIATIRGW